MNINLTLIAQAVVFAAFIWITVKFIWPYMLRAIEARQKTIADGLAAAEDGKRSLEASTRQAEERLHQGRERAAEIIAQAEKRAAQMVEEARTQAREEGNREKAAAQAEIEQQASRAREALREQVAALAVAGAEKILRREVDAKAHADLLAQLRQELR
ncbi:MAG TPA: F0F1 ATP synthase subunit B [Burkholderiales bacterium]|jgi:F-type H+-transporting ATPase subunit b